MGLGDHLFKLGKLKITAYKTIKRNEEISDGVFEVMFNPESMTQSYEILYGNSQALGTSGKPQHYASSKPADLSLSLVLDGTGTTEMGVVQFTSPQTVSKRVEHFLKVAFDINGATHKPNHLTLEWGDIKFNCCLSNLNVRYTSFDRQGKPLRADLDIKLIADEDSDDLQKKDRKSSPDLSHSRVVRAGDTLPLLAKEIYGSSTHYLWVAQANDLDEIRCLTPGQWLVFPPLPTATASAVSR